MPLVSVVLLLIVFFSIFYMGKSKEMRRNEGEGLNRVLKPARACATESPDCCFTQYKYNKVPAYLSISRESNEYQNIQTTSIDRKSVV